MKTSFSGLGKPGYLISALLVTCLLGCSSGNTPNPSSSTPKSTTTAPPSPSDTAVKPSAVKISLTFATNLDVPPYQNCTLVTDPKADTLGQKLVSCEIIVHIANQSKTEFEYDCDAWFNLSNGERYYYRSNGDGNDNCSPKILNPGKQGDLYFQVELPYKTTISELDLGNSSSSVNTVFNNLNARIPSTCRSGKDMFGNAASVCK